MTLDVFDHPPPLGELLDAGAVRELVRDIAELHGVGVQIADREGVLLAAGAGPGARSGGRRFLEEPLLFGGVQVGAVVLGPIDGADAGEAARADRILRFVRAAVSGLVQAGMARAATGALYAAAVRESHRELAELRGKAEELAARGSELDRLKGNFLAAMSHELRTPLTSVIGYSEMLLQGLAGDLTPEQRSYVQTIMDKGEHLLNLVGSVIDAARAGSGLLQVRREAVGVGDLVEAALVPVRPLCERRRIRVHAEVPPGLPAVLADREKLRQALLNLVGNAVKFSRDGGAVAVGAAPGRLAARDARSAPFPGEDDGVTIWVRDGGIGISPEHQPRIFEPFFQVDGSMTREFDGAGIGLALVRSLVVGMGGRVWVESELGRGSTFFIALPAQRGVGS